MSISAGFKEQVFQHFRQAIAEKIALLQNGLQDLAASAESETKSSAGDKFETGRAMLHIEQDNIRRQLVEAISQKSVMDRIDPDTHTDHIIPGSLVQIAGDYYYLTTALGKVAIDGKKIFSLSAQSPLGAQLVNCRVGDKVLMNGVERIVGDFL